MTGATSPRPAPPRPAPPRPASLLGPRPPPRCPVQLFMLYGFCDPANDSDGVELWCPMAPAAADPLAAAKAAVLLRADLRPDERPFLLTAAGPPPELWAVLRVQVCSCGLRGSCGLVVLRRRSMGAW